MLVSTAIVFVIVDTGCEQVLSTVEGSEYSDGWDCDGDDHLSN